MPAVGTIKSICSGHGSFPPRPPAEGEPFFTVNDQPVLVQGSMYLPHTDGMSAHTGTAIGSNSWFTVNGKTIVVVGDKVSCGSTVAMGDPTLLVG